MKEYASPCCGSCTQSLTCKYIDLSKPCNLYKPQNPIKNYEDELLKLAIKNVKTFCDNCLKKIPQLSCDNCEIYQDDVFLIKKITGKKWEEING